MGTKKIASQTFPKVIGWQSELTAPCQPRHERSRATMRISLFALTVLGSILGTPQVSRAQSLRISKERVLLTDEAANGPVLDRNTKVAVHQSGLLALAESRSSWVGYYSSERRTWVRVGRNGRGPGEFIGHLSIGWRGDTFWIADGEVRRLTTLTHFGDKKPISRTLPGIGSAERAFGVLQALVQQGMVVGVQSLLSNNRPAQMLPSLVLLLDRNGSTVVDTLFEFDERTAPLVVNNGYSTFLGSQPFGNRSSWASSSNGRYVAGAEWMPARSTLSSNARSSTQITVYDLSSSSSRKVFSVAVPAMAKPSEREIDAVVLDHITRINVSRQTGQKMTRAELRNALYVPDSRSAVSEIVVGNDGAILARFDDYSLKLARYTWIDGLGRPKGTFSVPISQRIRALQGRRIWSVRMNEDDSFSLIEQSFH